VNQSLIPIIEGNQHGVCLTHDKVLGHEVLYLGLEASK